MATRRQRLSEPRSLRHPRLRTGSHPVHRTGYARNDVHAPCTVTLAASGSGMSLPRLVNRRPAGAQNTEG